MGMNRQIPQPRAAANAVSSDPSKTATECNDVSPQRTQITGRKGIDLGEGSESFNVGLDIKSMIAWGMVYSAEPQAVHCHAESMRECSDARSSSRVNGGTGELQLSGDLAVQSYAALTRYSLPLFHSAQSNCATAKPGGVCAPSISGGSNGAP
jgi:hypothetical protein